MLTLHLIECSCLKNARRGVHKAAEGVAWAAAGCPGARTRVWRAPLELRHLIPLEHVWLCRQGRKTVRRARGSRQRHTGMHRQAWGRGPRAPQRAPTLEEAARFLVGEVLGDLVLAALAQLLQHLRGRWWGVGILLGPLGAQSQEVEPPTRGWPGAA